MHFFLYTNYVSSIPSIAKRSVAKAAQMCRPICRSKRTLTESPKGDPSIRDAHPTTPETQRNHNLLCHPRGDREPPALRAIRHAG